MSTNCWFWTVAAAPLTFGAEHSFSWGQYKLVGTSTESVGTATQRFAINVGQ